MVRTALGKITQLICGVEGGGGGAGRQAHSDSPTIGFLPFSIHPPAHRCVYLHPGRQRGHKAYGGVSVHLQAMIEALFVSAALSLFAVTDYLRGRMEL